MTSIAPGQGFKEGALKLDSRGAWLLGSIPIPIAGGLFDSEV